MHVPSILFILALCVVSHGYAIGSAAKPFKDKSTTAEKEQARQFITIGSGEVTSGTINALTDVWVHNSHQSRTISVTIDRGGATKVFRLRPAERKHICFNCKNAVIAAAWFD